MMAYTTCLPLTPVCLTCLKHQAQQYPPARFKQADEEPWGLCCCLAAGSIMTCAVTYTYISTQNKNKTSWNWIMPAYQLLSHFILFPVSTTVSVTCCFAILPLSCAIHSFFSVKPFIFHSALLPSPTHGLLIDWTLCVTVSVS